MHPKDIAIADYTYKLPDERIAAYPLPERDGAKLLVYRHGNIQQDIYKNIAQYLPGESLLVFNNTRVIPARILFKKATGAIIEIFCLEPNEPVNEYALLMQKNEKVRWKCLIGGAGKWKEKVLIKKCCIKDREVEFQARMVEKQADTYVVEFSWQPAQYSFAEIIEQAGETPLPPYIKRKPAESDRERYQTVYASHDGSVAAPTAGLHFTPTVFETLAERHITAAYITLHVGAGTFKPVKAAFLRDHHMHAEWIDVSEAVIRGLIENIHNITAVGTTSLRTLESLYWIGIKTILFPNCKMEDLTIQQWEVYENPLSDTAIAAPEALTALLGWLKKNNCQHIIAQTRLLIAPGYHLKMVKAIVTNFHQPQSTLLLLIAAAIGKDWKDVYNYALNNDFRFLSYGDGSLLYLTKDS